MRTVIVRLFEPEARAGDVGLHGIVEDVGTGSSTPFTSLAHLIDAILAIAARDGDAT